MTKNGEMTGIERDSSELQGLKRPLPFSKINGGVRLGVDKALTHQYTLPQNPRSDSCCPSQPAHLRNANQTPTNGAESDAFAVTRRARKRAATSPRTRKTLAKRE